MATTMEQRRAYRGTALFSYGFRPFFLFGAIASAVSIAVWLPVFTGRFAAPPRWSAVDWHIHEMLFGYVAAVIAGFLLTAVPNWTGRLPIQGRPLAGLFLVWIAGRFAIVVSSAIGWLPALAIDSAFLVLLAMAIAREIIAGRKWNNLPVVAIVLLFAAVNAGFHLEAHFAGAADYTKRAAIALVIVLVSLIGGRIVPSFTRNWLARRAPGRMPQPFGFYDRLTIASSVLALAAWIVAPDSLLSGLLLLLAAVLQAGRVSRWAGERTTSDRLVLILHIGYAFVPLGFALTAASAFGLVPSGAGVHAWTGGAIGTMTLAVMTRASLGHTGQPLAANAATQAIYACVVIAALSRVAAPLIPGLYMPLLMFAGVAWCAAFSGYALSYGPLLLRARG